jgi:hypothetical protein
MSDQPVITIHSQRNEYARTVYSVDIPVQIRRDYRDQQIVNIVDAGGDVRKADVCNNFGGTVTPQLGGYYRVVVFTD